MKIGILKETAQNEHRVALLPEGVTRALTRLKDIEIFVEKGAGEAAFAADDAYIAAGAKSAAAQDIFAADILLAVQPLSEKQVEKLKTGTLLVGHLNPHANRPLLEKLAAQGVSAVAVERIPRTSRAQSMDVLSSQANLAGYRAVLEGAAHFDKLFPMLMTAAGSSKPAKVIVLGAGVAGLQAIATARRLGAAVHAFDVRAEVKEQIESLGAKFIAIETGEEGSGAGGYAKALSPEAQKRQQEALQEVLKTADIIISTAQIPGKEAPELITEEAVKNMAPGSVIVDMAAGSGGNCKLTEADKVVVKHGVTLVGHTNYPSQMAREASNFYGRNLIALLELFVKDGALTFNLNDDIVAAALVVHEGQVRV